ncbi:MAG: rhodanese-related sulfurtransferase [Rickettsiales bacterium]
MTDKNIANNMFKVTAFYHFFDFPDFEEKRFVLLNFLKERGIKGSVLIAHEGINGTVAGNAQYIDETLAFLEKKIIGEKFEHKDSYSEQHPFIRTKVRLKKELISMGRPSDPLNPGTHLDSKQWNELLADPDTILIDSRNSYETHLGKFKNAIDPDIPNFKHLADFIDSQDIDKKKAKIATYCTGGIRCERFTAWLKDEGFENVYHLKGGILKYLEEIPEDESLWEGECYVFDKRIAVGHGLVPSSTASMCNACGHSLLPEDREHPSYDEHVICPYCVNGKLQTHQAPESTKR